MEKIFSKFGKISEKDLLKYYQSFLNESKNDDDSTFLSICILLRNNSESSILAIKFLSNLYQIPQQMIPFTLNKKIRIHFFEKLSINENQKQIISMILPNLSQLLIGLSYKRVFKYLLKLIEKNNNILILLMDFISMISSKNFSKFLLLCIKLSKDYNIESLIPILLRKSSFEVFEIFFEHFINNLNFDQIFSKILISIYCPPIDSNSCLKICNLFISGLLSFDSSLFHSFYYHIQRNLLNLNSNEINFIELVNELNILFPNFNNYLFELSINNLTKQCPHYIFIELFFNEFNESILNLLIQRIIESNQFEEYILSFLKFKKNSKINNFNKYLDYLIISSFLLTYINSNNIINIFRLLINVENFYFLNFIIKKITDLFTLNNYNEITIDITKKISNNNIYFEILYSFLKLINK